MPITIDPQLSMSYILAKEKNVQKSPRPSPNQPTLNPI
jgi:hypothetical protein